MNKKARLLVKQGKNKEQKTSHYFKKQLKIAEQKLKISNQKIAILKEEYDNLNNIQREKLDNAQESSEAIVRLRKDYERVCDEHIVAFNFLKSKGFLKEFLNIVDSFVTSNQAKIIEVPLEEIPSEDIIITETEAVENNLSIVEDTELGREE